MAMPAERDLLVHATTLSAIGPLTCPRCHAELEVATVLRDAQAREPERPAAPAVPVRRVPAGVSGLDDDALQAARQGDYAPARHRRPAHEPRWSLERAQALKRAMEEKGVSKAAEEAGISKANAYNIVSRFGLTKARAPRREA